MKVHQHLVGSLEEKQDKWNLLYKYKTYLCCCLPSTHDICCLFISSFLCCVAPIFGPFLQNIICHVLCHSISMQISYCDDWEGNTAVIIACGGSCGNISTIIGRSTKCKRYPLAQLKVFSLSVGACRSITAGRKEYHGARADGGVRQTVSDCGTWQMAMRTLFGVSVEWTWWQRTEQISI